MMMMQRGWERGARGEARALSRQIDARGAPRRHATLAAAGTPLILPTPTDSNGLCVSVAIWVVHRG